MATDDGINAASGSSTEGVPRLPPPRGCPGGAGRRRGAGSGRPSPSPAARSSSTQRVTGSTPTAPSPSRGRHHGVRAVERRQRRVRRGRDLHRHRGTLLGIGSSGMAETPGEGSQGWVAATADVPAGSAVGWSTARAPGWRGRPHPGRPRWSSTPRRSCLTACPTP
ncbi:hypothetical protein [Tessaracoccus coleopterorum]|uniref:hypothetical protein n=1 Tax=Tessaracoccus coleopterorum TaxID=2714950 RepID=UPI001E5025D5|nr:hypothetical protein [Tessaracoccus coleopterorum]